MPASTPEAKARKAKRKQERRKERMADPAFRAKINARHAKAAKARRAEMQALMRKFPLRDPYGPGESARVIAEIDRRKRERARDRKRGKRKNHSRPFAGCDGEGITKPDGSHDYVYFRMGDRDLAARPGSRLNSRQLLDFILASPPDTAKANGPINVGYYFTYDATMILADVPAPALKKIFSREAERGADGSARARAAARNGQWSPFTFFSLAGARYGVDFLPGHYFRVMRPGVKGSCRTIVDVARNFQRSFLAALKQHEIDREHWPLIEAMKSSRAEFSTITPDMISYCARECADLALLMEAHRADRLAVGIDCSSFDGPGSVAAHWFKQRGMTQFKRLSHRFQKGLIELVHAAYYGGRFENSYRGFVAGPIEENDLNSAYPAGLQHAPCILHGRWRQASALTLQAHIDRYESRSLGTPASAGSATFIAPIAFDHPDPAQVWCGLPHRSKVSTLSWPRRGRGVYWSVEILSALDLGGVVTVTGPGYVYERRCDCKPFGWLAERYQDRLDLGKDRRGFPIKIAINSVYGKTAQRIGAAPWQNPFYAGIATAWTRAQINRAIARLGQENVVMVATDAIYSRPNGASLDISDRLGGWGRKTFSSLFIVQSGLYWPPKAETDDAWKLKTRGVSRKFFADKTDAFEAAWRAYLGANNPIDQARLEPAIAVELRCFVGHRLALARGQPDLAGRWITQTKDLKFGFKSKRRLGEVEGEAERLDPLPGGHEESEVYTPETPAWKEAAGEFFRQADLFFEAMPDYVDRGAPVE